MSLIGPGIGESSEDAPKDYKNSAVYRSIFKDRDNNSAIDLDYRSSIVFISSTNYIFDIKFQYLYVVNKLYYKEQPTDLQTLSRDFITISSNSSNSDVFVIGTNVTENQLEPFIKKLIESKLVPECFNTVEKVITLFKQSRDEFLIKFNSIQSQLNRYPLNNPRGSMVDQLSTIVELISKLDDENKLLKEQIKLLSNKLDKYTNDRK